MIYPILTPEEAADYIQNGMNIGVSGFTIPGNVKVITPAIAKKAIREHEAGREFKVNIYSGASTNDYTDGELSRAHALNYRTPYQAQPHQRWRSALQRPPLERTCTRIPLWLLWQDGRGFD